MQLLRSSKPSPYNRLLKELFNLHNLPRNRSNNLRTNKLSNPHLPRNTFNNLLKRAQSDGPLGFNDRLCMKM